MGEVSIVGLDVAKNVFQAHGADESGTPVLRKKLRRDQVLGFFAKLSPCIVAMEACSGAHHWAREIGRLGHETRLVPAAYVKPFVKRQKNDAADGKAICEAALRLTMRFVAVKTARQQASASVFRARDLLVRQRTQLINALRGHLYEHGIAVAKGPSHVAKLMRLVEEEKVFPPEALLPLQCLASTLVSLEEKIGVLDKEIARRAKEDDVAQRLMTIPGIGPITATAIAALAPSAESFSKGRDFAAWLGLVPRQNSSGGKERLGKTTKMGERSLRRLLIIGATGVVRWATRNPPPAESWLARLLSRKPHQLVATALAGKMACIAWALMTSGGIYRASSATAA